MDKEIANDLDTISNKAFIAFQYYKEEWADYSKEEIRDDANAIDWDMAFTEVENGEKLNVVHCNQRSTCGTSSSCSF